MMRIVLFGPPTAGKSSLSFRAAQALGVAQVNAGLCLRRLAEEDPSIARALARGEPVGDGIVAATVRPLLAHPAGYVLEGFPRTISQLDLFLSWPEARDVGFILLDLDPALVPARHASRRTCPDCRRAQYEPGPCRMCGGKLQVRSDANQAALAARLDLYRRCEVPMLERLAASGSLERLEATGAAEQDLDRLMRVIPARASRREGISS